MSTVIGSTGKNKNEEYVVSLGEYKGRNFIDVRIHFHDKDDEAKLIPTKKGITLSKRNFQAVVSLMIKAYKELEKLPEKTEKSVAGGDDNDIPDPS